MKTDDFKNILRNTVNEELRKVLPELLNEYFNKSDKSTVSDRKSQTIPIPTQQPSTIIDKTVKKELRQYVKNPILNQILNETVVKIPTDVKIASGVTLNHSKTSFLSLSLKVESRCRILKPLFLKVSSTLIDVSIPELKINVFVPTATSS